MSHAWHSGIGLHRIGYRNKHIAVEVNDSLNQGEFASFHLFLQFLAATTITNRVELTAPVQSAIAEVL